MSRYRAGAAAEYRTMRLLEASGYTCLRAAGSHGPFDVVAFDGLRFRLIQVKRGTARLAPASRESLLLLKVPANASREYWRWPSRARTPIVEVL